MTPTVVLDTETTSLRHDRRAWEVGMIRFDGDGEREIGIYISDVDLSNADPITLVAGYLIGRGQRPALPWKSEDLSRAIGVTPEEFDRHTALGDCRWILAQLRVVAPNLLKEIA